MRARFDRVAVLAAAIICFAAGVSGQSVRKNGPMPFAVGETLAYEAKISKIIRGIAVADLVFTVAKAPESGKLLVKTSARSKGTLLKLARYSFLQELESTVETDEFRILRTSKHDVQKERVRDSVALFDYDDRRVTYTELDPREPMRPPRKIASEVSGETHDLVSAIYSLRMQPLSVGRSFTIKVSDSGLVYDVPVRVTARERQKTVLGTFNCFRIEPDVFGRGRLIENDGSMVIWMTDDARRLPVRAQVNSSIGRVEIKLRAASNLK